MTNSRHNQSERVPAYHASTGVNRRDPNVITQIMPDNTLMHMYIDESKKNTPTNISGNEPPLMNKITGKEIARNQPGSSYVSLDIESNESTELIKNYSRNVDSRNQHDVDSGGYHYKAPEAPLPQAAVERYLLEKFLEQDGMLNFQDIAYEMMNDDGTLPAYLGGAVSSFTANLGLDVMTVEKPRSNTISRRKALIGATVLGLSGALAVSKKDVVADAVQTIANKIDGTPYDQGEITPISYTVKDSDSARGIWGIVERTYPDMSDEEIKAYIDSGVIINETASEENRDSLIIWPGDKLKLPQP